VVEQAKLVRTEHGLVPEGEGWFVVNAREARWRSRDGELGRACMFEGEPGFAELGVRLHVVDPGQPNAMYHAEDAEEDFLVLSGECVLVVEGNERRLRAWDFVHCPPGTNHVFVGAGDAPCVLLMVGARRPDSGVRYPVDETAARYGASVEEEATSPAEAYARYPERVPVRYRDGDLPDLG
jgi:uncharacterized cupin superfamily protein